MDLGHFRSRTEPARCRVGPPDEDARRLLLAHVVSYVGTVLGSVALPVLAYQLTGSASHTATLVGLTLVPYVVLGLPVSALADRADRRKMMVGAELASAVLTASVGLASVVGAVTVAQLYVVTIGLGTAFVFMDAANFGAVVKVVRGEDIGHYLTRQWTIDATVHVAGPALAGALIGRAGATAVFTIDAVSFCASAVVLRSIATSLRSEVVPGRASLGDRLLAGARFLWGHRTVRSLTLLGIGNSLTAGAVLGLLVPVSVERLGLAADDGRIGVMYTAGAAGGLLAARLLRLAGPRVGVGTLVASAFAAATVLVAVLARQTSLVSAALAYGLFVVANQLIILNAITVRQRVTPDELQGRVNVLARMISVSGLPIGSTLAGVLSPSLGVTAAVTLAAAGSALSGVLVLAGPLRPVRSGTLRGRHAPGGTP